MLACCTVLCSSAKAQPAVAILPDKRFLASKGDFPTVVPAAKSDDGRSVATEAPKTPSSSRKELEVPCSSSRKEAQSPLQVDDPAPPADDGCAQLREQGDVHCPRAPPPCLAASESPPTDNEAESVLGDIGGSWRASARRDEAAPPRSPATLCDEPEVDIDHWVSSEFEDKPAQQGVGGFRQRARVLGAKLCLDETTTQSSGLDETATQPSVGRAWSEDMWGTIHHKPSGLRISPVKGIVVDGVQYSLSPEDLEFSEDDVLGSGSGGVVHVGLHRPSGERVAVKTLRVSDDDARREQMLKEIWSLAHISGCPYLIQWYAGFADTAKSCVHVVLEYMDRGSLADLRKRLAGQGLPAEHVACVAAQVLRGLQHLQSRKLLHRDVKPENILHDRRGRVKLTDFGISKDLARLPSAMSSTFVGTATYMAPERASGSDYSFESDVWSAGMVLYELATGRYPFPAASFVELFEGLCEGPEPRLEADAFPAPLRSLVASCLTRSPAERPDAAALCEREPVAGVGDEHVVAFAAWLSEFAT